MKPTPGWQVGGRSWRIRSFCGFDSPEEGPEVQEDSGWP